MCFKAYYISTYITICSALLLSIWSKDIIAKDLPYEQVFGSVDDMILGIENIHYIMFDQVDMVKSLSDSIEQDYICDIVAGYLWMSLPVRGKG